MHLLYTVYFSRFRVPCFLLNLCATVIQTYEGGNCVRLLSKQAPCSIFFTQNVLCFMWQKSILSFFRKEEFFWDWFLAHVHYILYMYETCVKLFTEDFGGH